MSNAKHTPGPWSIGGAYGHHAVKVTSSNGAQVVAMVVDSEVSGISHGAPVYVPFIEGHANARLIAAAPELLDALKAMLDQFNYSTVSGLVHDESMAIMKAREAIAKATGEQPK